MSEAVGLVVEQVDDAAVASSPVAGCIVEPHFDKLMGQVASIQAEVISSTANLFDLEEARDKAEQ